MARSAIELGNVLDEVFDVLDEVLGDTDPPLVDEDGEKLSDEDIRDEEPLFWCIQRINEVRDELKNSEPASAPT